MGMGTDKTKSVLVRVPGGPLSLDDLQPSLPMAATASILQWAGHETQIRDFGTLETMERYIPASLQELSQDLSKNLIADGEICPAETWKERRKVKSILKRLHEQRQVVWTEIAGELTSLKHLDFISFFISNASDLEAAEFMSRQVQRMRPRLKTIAMGPYFYSQAHQAVEPSRHFHAVFVGRPDQSMALLADRIHDTARWTDVPHLAFADGTRLCVTESCPTLYPEDLPLPAYDPETYPALANRRKVMMFTLEDVRSVNGDATRRGCAKTAETVCKEMGLIRNAYGVRAFHLSGTHTETRPARNLAYEILSKGIQIRYTRDMHVATTDRATVTALSTSGCLGGAFQIDTGSQRLMDRYYGHPFTVTDTEQAIRHSKFSNLYTILNLTYPSSEDDYHTESETLRLIERTLPHAVHLCPPNPANNSAASHDRRPTLLQRHKVPKALRVDEGQFKRAVAQRNVPVRMRAPWVLMAELAGYHGQEKEFVDQFTHHLFSGNMEALHETLSNLNRSAGDTPHRLALKPFTSFPDVVGN